MKNFKILLGLLVVSLLLSLKVGAESNSIGVSPSTISLQALKPGLSATREIVISRSNTSTAEIFVITTDNSEASSWLAFNPGKEVAIAAGQNRASVNVTISIPSTAAYKRYTTSIRVVLKQELTDPGVNIQTGALINFDLLITNEQVISLKVISANIPNLITGSNIKLTLRMQNDGNVPSAPSRAVLIITDSNGRQVTTLENLNIDAVGALSTEDKIIEFNGSNLLEGEYLATLKVYDIKGVEIFSYNLSFRIGASPTPTPQVENTAQPTQTYVFIGVVVFGFVLIVIALVNILKINSKKYKK